MSPEPSPNGPTALRSDPVDRLGPHPDPVRPPRSAESRRLTIIIVVAAGLAVVLMVVVGSLVIVNRPVKLPGEFAGGRLLSSTEQYARDRADGLSYATQYKGPADDYRDYLSTTLTTPSEENPLPVQPVEVLDGRYDREGTEIYLTLRHYAVDEDLWDSYVQQRVLEQLLGDGRVAFSEGTYCYPRSEAEEYFSAYCARVTDHGFWTATASSSNGSDGTLPGLSAADFAEEVSALR